jgi:curli biogenesis system outer membrane secretion channel CsgG
MLLACSSPMPLPDGNPADYVTPTVAVMKFDNHAGSFMSWDLGTGMRDILVDRLVATRRFRVIERPELNAVVAELHFQNSGMTREQQRAVLGQVKNVQYLIKGTITDFGQVQSTNIFGGTSDWGIFGGAWKAVMGMILYVVDVESGEIIASESLQGSVNAGSVGVNARYKDVAFGGSTFNKTPLGEATAQVISRAVVKITATIASRPWTPRIAAINADGTIVLNGGTDRALTPGVVFEVLGEGRTFKDPETGDVLGVVDQPPIGRLRITRVTERYSVAVREEAVTELVVGMRCRRVGRPG